MDNYKCTVSQLEEHWATLYDEWSFSRSIKREDELIFVPVPPSWAGQAEAWSLHFFDYVEPPFEELPLAIGDGFYYDYQDIPKGAIKV